MSKTFKKISFKLGEFFFGFEEGDGWNDVDSTSLLLLSILCVAAGFGIGVIFSIYFG